jgi:hypothetical protein
MKYKGGTCGLRTLLVALLVTTLPACMTNVEHARPGQSLEPREGKALVISRIRFFYDGREIFPWDASAFYDAVLDIERAEARHIWLLPLDATAGSWELRPDVDGTLTLWLPPGDYALVGRRDDPNGPADPNLAFMALLRVPSDRPVVYAGELTFAEDFRAGWHAHPAFGDGSVTTHSMAEAIRKVEASYGALPNPPAVSVWCVGKDLPAANNITEFVSQSRRLLDVGCSTSP